MTTEDKPLFIVLETTSVQGKTSWAIWQRDPGSPNYSYLVARVYDGDSAESIVELLNIRAAASK